MTYILLVVLLSANQSSAQQVTQLPMEDYKTCASAEGELRALLHKANIKAITTCVKTK